MSQRLIVDGQWRTVTDVLKDSRLCSLLSNEGPMDTAEIVRAARWNE